MKYFCILLKSDDKRKKHVLEHLLPKIPSLNIISAVDANTNELEYHLGKRENDKNFLSFARRGQLGCLLSHIKVWKKIVEEETEYSTILEDDAILSQNFSNISQFSNLKYDFIYLFVHPDSKNKIETFTKYSPLLDVGYPTFGTVGYCISYSMAKELIQFFESRIATTVDDSITWYLSNYNKKYYCVNNNLVETAGQLYFHREDCSELGSTIARSGLYKDSTNITFSFYMEEEDWYIYPCCTIKDGNLRFEKGIDKEKLLTEDNVVAFSTDGWVKNKLTQNYKISKTDLWIKKQKGEKAVLVTGGLGFLGSNTTYEIIQQFPNYSIVIIDDLSNSYSEVLDILSLFSNKIHFYRGDVKDSILLEKIFKYHNIVSVIHFAAYKAVGESVQNPLKYYDNNIGGLISLLKTMQKFAVKKLIFSSSATVYGNPNSLPLTEKSKTSTLNPYGRTKLFAEEMLRDMTDMKIVCLRYFNPVGGSLLKETPKGVPNNLFPYIVSVIKGERNSLKIYGDDYETIDGTAVRDYVHVKDLSKGHIAALKYLENSDSHFSIFNLGTGKGFTVLEVVKRFAEILGRPIPYEIVDRREGDAPIVYADCSKAAAILGWKTELTLEDMIHDSLKI
jgi:UDP-glucose 4-epimerase